MTADELPEGNYAIVELLGHTTLVGRISEIECFGTKMMQIEPLFNGSILPAILQGGGSIYRITPCSPEVAWRKAPKSTWQLPASILSIVPIAALPAPEPSNPAPFDEEEGHF